MKPLPAALIHADKIHGGSLRSSVMQRYKSSLDGYMAMKAPEGELASIINVTQRIAEDYLRYKFQEVSPQHKIARKAYFDRRRGYVAGIEKIRGNKSHEFAWGNVLAVESGINDAFKSVLHVDIDAVFNRHYQYTNCTKDMKRSTRVLVGDAEKKLLACSILGKSETGDGFKDATGEAKAALTDVYRICGLADGDHSAAVLARKFMQGAEKAMGKQR